MFIPFSGGLVNRKEPRELQPGDLVTAAGVEYRPGSPNVFTTGARALDKTFGAGDVYGLAVAQYDSGTDKLIGAVGTTLYEHTVTAGGAGAQVQLESANIAFGSQPTNLSAAMHHDRLYLASGVALSISSVAKQFNLVRHSDGTWRRLGMDKPIVRPTVTGNAGETVAANSYVPASAADSGGWVNVNNVGDADTTVTTYASASLAVVTTSVFTWTWAAQAISGYSLRVKHAGSAIPQSEAGRDVGAGGAGRESIDATLKIEVSENSGSSWTTVSEQKIPYAAQWSTHPLSVATNLSTVRVRGTLTFTSGSAPANSLIYHIEVSNASASSFTTVTGFRYIISEWSRTYGIESSFGDESELITMTAHNRVPVTLPGTAQNAITTHLRVYRSTDGAAAGEYDRYTLADEVPIGTTTWYDTIKVPFTEVGWPTLPVLIVGTGEDLTFYPKNDKPPLYKSICVYQGSLVGVPVDDSSLKEGIIAFSHPYQFDSRPALYNIPTRSPRNDAPQVVVNLDNVLLVFFPSWTKRVRGLPLIVSGVFDATQPDDASTQRGCAGIDAYDTFSFPDGDGRAFCAVLDYKGLYVTDGYEFRSWSDNIILMPEAYLGTTHMLNINYISSSIVRNNPRKQRVELYYVPYGASAITRRLDFYYGEMRPDGQPRVTGPHAINARSAAYAWVPALNDWVRWVGSTGGNVYIEDSGTQDASNSFNASSHVERVVKTGNLPIAGLGLIGRIKRYALRFVRGSYQAISHTLQVLFDSGEIQQLTNTETTTTPQPFLVNACGESFNLQIDDTGTSAKAELLGVNIEAEPVGDELSALTAVLDASAATTSLPTS